MIELFDISVEGFGDAEPVQRQQASQAMIPAAGEAGLDEEHTELVAIQTDRRGLVVDAGTSHMDRWGHFDQLLLDAIPVEPSNRREPSRYRRFGFAFLLQPAAEPGWAPAVSTVARPASLRCVWLKSPWLPAAPRGFWPYPAMPVARMLVHLPQRRRSVPLDLVIAASVLGSQTTSDDQMTGYGWVMMIIFATLFAALLVTAIWALYSYTTRTRADQERGSPEELLAERYARGDITTEEYEERLDTLRE